jgi:hypothetical protein
MGKLRKNDVNNTELSESDGERIPSSDRLAICNDTKPKDKLIKPILKTLLRDMAN